MHLNLLDTSDDDKRSHSRYSWFRSSAIASSKLLVQKCDLGKAEARSDRNLVTLDSAVGRLPIEGTVSLNSRYHGDEVERAEALTRAIESQVTPLKPEIKKITNQELFVSWLKLLVKKCDHPQFILVHN